MANGDFDLQRFQELWAKIQTTTSLDELRALAEDVSKALTFITTGVAGDIGVEQAIADILGVQPGTSISQMSDILLGAWQNKQSVLTSLSPTAPTAAERFAQEPLSPQATEALNDVFSGQFNPGSLQGLSGIEAGLILDAAFQVAPMLGTTPGQELAFWGNILGDPAALAALQISSGGQVPASLQRLGLEFPFQFGEGGFGRAAGFGQKGQRPAPKPPAAPEGFQPSGAEGGDEITRFIQQQQPFALTGQVPQGTDFLSALFPGGTPTAGGISRLSPEQQSALSGILSLGGISPQEFSRTSAGVTPAIARERQPRIREPAGRR